MARVTTRRSRSFSFSGKDAKRGARSRKGQTRRPADTVRQEKRQRFREIIEPRVGRAIHQIRLVSYGGDRRRYHYTPEDIQLLRETLYAEVDKALAPYFATAEGPEGFSFKE